AARSIGVVTSPGAAALHDVVTALRRRAPHVPVVIAPAQVQGQAAPGDLVRALESLYARIEAKLPGAPDVILLVRGGGSIEDLWAFNDERLARTIARSPVPLISGVGHETDFTIADFCADVRAPTPTAAAEIAAQPRQAWLHAVELMQGRLIDTVRRRLDMQAQRIDRAAHRLGRPSALLARQQVGLQHQGMRLREAMSRALALARARQEDAGRQWPTASALAIDRHRVRLADAQRALALLDPTLVLQRGYAWLADGEGEPITQAASLRSGQPVVATLADGEVDLTVSARR
ncbi:MAG: exodeoxyribonuclease VII large subunit, partial [Burkholderiaceae bacterium]|nr:exodeoxyribonuclease VII large subunit [Burkholderiaceae bacterium]